MSVPPPEVETLRQELEREHERLLALRDVSTAVGSTLDLNELLDVVLGRVSSLLACDRATLYVHDEETGQLWARVPNGEGGELEIRLGLGDGVAGWCAKNGSLVNIPDAYADARFNGDWDKRSGFRTGSILCAPLKNPNGRIVGVLQALNKQGGVFDDEDEALIEALGAQLAVAIENSKLFLSVVGKNMELLEAKEQLETKVRELDVLFEIANVAAVSHDMDEMLNGALAGAMRAVDAGGASILIEGDPYGELRFKRADVADVKLARVRSGEGVSGWVAEHGIPQRINEVRKHPKFSVEVQARVGYEPRSALSVPLAWDDGAGALTLFDKSRGRDAFDDGDVKLATVIAGHVSTAIGLAKARSRRTQEERLLVIGQFMSGVLHDLKTPMTVIGGYVQLLAEETDPDKRNRYADAVHQQIGFIKTMTQETLAFARGDRKLWIRKVYVQQFFTDLATQLEREFDGRPATFELVLEDRGVAYFDPAKVQRAVHNLARNAAEAIGAKGGKVTLTVARRSDDGALVLRMADDGPGIADEIQSRLFESFATHGKANGSGLGLAIVRSIVDDHQGHLDLQSQPGETTFTITLPQDAAHAGEEASP